MLANNDHGYYYTQLYNYMYLFCTHAAVAAAVWRAEIFDEVHDFPTQL